MTLVIGSLVAAAVVGGALNAVAGGGAFLILPALLYAGTLPIAANATTTLVLWPASAASVVAYRRELAASRQWLPLLGGLSLVGGLAGALLLVRTSDAGFMRLLPWLMLLAAAAFTFGGRLWAVDEAIGAAHASPHPSRSLRRPKLLILLQLVIAIYGGYFGGGQGIMMLATMSLAGMSDIHEMNGLKAVLGATINGVALAAFIMDGLVSWRWGLVMAAGAGAGGYAAATLAQRVDGRWIRWIVIVVGWAMTVYFFVR